MTDPKVTEADSVLDGIAERLQRVIDAEESAGLRIPHDQVPLWVYHGIREMAFREALQTVNERPTGREWEVWHRYSANRLFAGTKAQCAEWLAEQVTSAAPHEGDGPEWAWGPVR